MGMRFTAGFISLVMFVGAGCDRTKSTPDPSGPSEPPAGSVSAAVSASAAAPEPPDPKSATKWTGTYESKQVTLETPEKVRDFTWKNDDGSQAVGKGQLTMNVKDGVISGDATGPLGPQTLVGMLEDTTLRLELLPSEPTSTLPMTGSTVVELKDGAFTGTIRCSGPKGVIVREVAFTLEPAK